MYRSTAQTSLQRLTFQQLFKTTVKETIASSGKQISALYKHGERTRLKKAKYSLKIENFYSHQKSLVCS